MQHGAETKTNAFMDAVHTIFHAEIDAAFYPLSIGGKLVFQRAVSVNMRYGSLLFR